MMAKAYHINNNFNEAIKYYRLSKTKKNKIDPRVINEADKKIKECTYAKRLIKTPINVKIVNLSSAINTEYEEYVPVITADESEIFFTSRRPNTTGGKTDPLIGDFFEDIYYSKKEQKPDIEIPANFILATIHRAENTDNSDRLGAILDALNEIANEIKVILPLHPRTAKIIRNFKYNTNNLIIIEPIGYLEMVYMLARCKLVMTDSGGLQKEAFFFKKPCITLRDETEWVELTENGFNTIVGANKDMILNAYNTQKYEIDFNMNLYGNEIGRASCRERV